VVRLELGERRDRCAADHRHRQALDGAGSEQPDNRVGEREQRQADDSGTESGEDDRTASEAVRELTADEQGRNQDDGVGGEDHGQHRARKSEPLAVDRVERRRKVRAQQKRGKPTGDDREREGPPARRSPPLE
jgi:hypothetical protein